MVVPASDLLTADAAANLARSVEGGTLPVSCFSGIVDEFDAVHPGGFAAPLREVLGLTVEEFLPLRAAQQVQLSWDGAELTGDVWAGAVTLEGAQVMASYVDGPAAGGPAITRNPRGTGAVRVVRTDRAIP